MAWFGNSRTRTTTPSSGSPIEPEYNERIAFQELLNEELKAISDHELALSLSGLSITDADRASRAEYKAKLAAALRKQQDVPGVEVASKTHASASRSAKQLCASASGENGIQSASPETDSAQTQNVVVEQTDPGSLTKNVIKCDACMEVTGIEESLHLQCEHTYCHACLLTLFTSTMLDTTLFPPQCCKFLIPLDACRTVLSEELIKEFELKVEELATPSPTYCANVDCSKFIRLGEIVSGVARCVFCDEDTCVLCKSRSHKGLCPSDPHVQLLMDLAKRSNWQQCTKCSNMVELTRGCFHMM